MLAELGKHDIILDDMNIFMELGNAEAIIKTIEAGFGVSFVSRLSAEWALDQGTVAQVPVAGFDLRRRIYMAQRTIHEANRAVEAFWGFVHDPANSDLLRMAEVDQVLVCGFDDRMAQMHDTEFVEWIAHAKLNAKWLLVGDDFRFGARRNGDISVLRSQAGNWGYEVEAMSSVMLGGLRVSSTTVRNCLDNGDLDGAARLLGRAYTMAGRVEHGDGIGTGLGYPTANVRLNRIKAPLTGIFVVEVDGLADTAVPGVASLGVRPTVTENGRASLEVHLFDFNRDIYGQRIVVRFLRKLRDEVKFAGVGELVRQMDRDAQQAREYFAQTGSGLRHTGIERQTRP